MGELSARGCDTQAVFPVLGRAGLGNMLFPWARALVLAAQLDADFLAPSWWRPRLGPYLRRENDKRQYHTELRQPNIIQYMRDRSILLRSDIRTEDGLLLQKSPWFPRATRATVRITQGLGDYFQPLYGHERLIGDAFRGQTIASGGNTGIGDIAVHVRLGDFAAEGATNVGHQNISTPVQWFVDQIKTVHSLAPNTTFGIYSDGTDRELEAILRLPGTQRSGSGRPVNDLLEIGRHKLILGSKSSYSAWAAFIGETHLVVRRGENRYLSGWNLACEVGASDFPDDLLKACKIDGSL